MDGRDLDCMPQLVPNRQKGLNNQSGDADSHSNSGRCKHISESYMVSLPPAGETIHALLHRESQNADALVTATRTQILVPPITQLWLFWCLKFIRYVCMSGEKDPSHIKFSMVLGIWESGGIKALQTWRQGWSAPTPPSASNPTTSLHITGLPMFLQKVCLSRGMGVAGPSLGQS